MRLRELLLGLLAALSLQGCAGTPDNGVVADVDESTGDSLARPKEPLRLATTRPALSTVGKDYLLIAPVAVSGSVHRGLYLWFAIGSTVDRELHGLSAPGIDRIVLLVDGMPMSFDLVDWSERSGVEPYRVPVKTHRSFAARVTRNQLERIRSADALSAWVTNPSQRSPDYELVRGHPSDWNTF